MPGGAVLAIVDAAAQGDSVADTITAVGGLLVAVIGAVTALVLAVRKRGLGDEDIPKLRDELAKLRRLVLAADRHMFTLERAIAASGAPVPERPAELRDQVAAEEGRA